MHIRHQQAWAALNRPARDSNGRTGLESLRHEVMAIAHAFQRQEDIARLQGTAIEIDARGLARCPLAHTSQGAAGGLGQFIEGPERGIGHVSHAQHKENAIEPDSGI